MTDVPYPAAERFDEAAAAFDFRKPIGTRIAGLAIIKITAQLIFWSVNYEVDDHSQFPSPEVENCGIAKAKFQSFAPRNTKVHNVSVCEIKPGGLVLRKWQVQYSVNLQAQAPQTSKSKQKPDKRKAGGSHQLDRQNVMITKHQQSTPSTKIAYHEQGTLDYIAHLMNKQIKQVSSLKKKYNSVFISKSNVFNYTGKEIKTWFSPKKRNFSFALKRILKKHSKISNKQDVNQFESAQPRHEKLKAIKFVKAQESSGHKRQFPIVADNISSSPAESAYKSVPPKDTYITLEATRMFQKIRDITHKDKIKVLASLRYVALCNKENHVPRCVRASEFLRRYDCVGSKPVLKAASEMVLSHYQVSDEYLSSIKLFETNERSELQKACDLVHTALC